VLAAIGLAIVAGSGGIALKAAPGASSGFVPPSEPMRFTRILERDLGDGRKVTVTRSWRVHFVPHPSGYRVRGELIAVDVDAPPRLAALAEVERGNGHRATFPIALDETGAIVSTDAHEQSQIAGLAEAVREVLKDASDGERAGAMQYVLAVERAGARMMSQWPRDLFFPAASPRTEERALPLPGGTGGHVTVHFEAQLDRTAQHLARAERHIVTTVGDTVRTSRETWLLAPF